MNDNSQDRRLLGRLLVPVALLHVVCCGGLVLVVLFGSAVLASIGGYLNDPLIQVAGLLLLAGAGQAVWRRYRRTRRTSTNSPAARGDSRQNKNVTAPGQPESEI